MKNITKKVLILMMVIPLLLIFTMVATIDMTSILVDIPVTNVTIEGEKILFVDVASQSNHIQLNTTISPKEATNKNVTYSTEHVDENNKALVEVSQTGLVHTRSTGNVKVIATASGRQDSILINFFSTRVLNFTKKVNEVNVELGESIVLENDVHFSKFPYDAEGTVTFSTESKIIKVDKYTGEIDGLLTGSAEVIASVEGIKYDEATASFIETTHEIVFNVNVEGDSGDKLLMFSGGATSVTEKVYAESKTINFIYKGRNVAGDLSYEVLNNASEYFKSIEINYLEDNLCTLVVALNDNAPEGEYKINLVAADNIYGEVTIVKTAPTIEIKTNKTTFAKSNTMIELGAQVIGLDDGYSITYESSNKNVFEVKTSNNTCYAKAKQEV